MTTLAGVLFLMVSVGVAMRQRRARSCPLHRRWIGAVAWLIAGLTACLGAGLILFDLFRFLSSPSGS